MTTTTMEFLDRDTVIARIKAALKRRSGKAWSVTGGRGTGWGWIRIDAPPAARTWRRRVISQDVYEDYDSGQRGGMMSPADRALLGQVLGRGGPCHHQGELIPASSAHYREYLDRAEGRTPTVIAERYWD
jgi:hypothetical protein